MRDRQVMGPPGPEGERGERGKSAYDLARDAGFRGSLEQWLASLRGPAGERGLVGSQGPQGCRGPDRASTTSELPLRADFIRDDITDLTLQVLVRFPDAQTVAITPERDDRGFMTGAVFS